MSIPTLIFDGLGGASTRMAGGVRADMAAYTGLPEPPPAGYQYATCTTTSFVGLSLQQGSVPAVAVGDVFIVQFVTSTSGYAIAVNGDGTVIINSSGDTSRQSFLYQVYRKLTNTIDGPQTVWVNEIGPVWNTPVFINNVPINVAFTAVSLSSPSYAQSPEGDTLSFAIASGALPTGMSLSGAGSLSGTPTVLGTFNFTASAADSTGTTTISAASSIIIAAGVGPPPVSLTAPNIVGMDSTDATTAILAAGFTVGAVTSASSTTIAVGLVLVQTPAATTVVPSPASLAFVLSSGPPTPGPPTVSVVPNLVGFTQEQAQAVLNAQNLTLGAVSSSYD